MRMPSLSSIFDNRGANKPQSYNDYPLPPQETIACKNMQHALAMIHDKAREEGEDPTSYPVVVDTNVCNNTDTCSGELVGLVEFAAWQEAQRQ